LVNTYIETAINITVIKLIRNKAKISASKLLGANIIYFLPIKNNLLTQRQIVKTGHTKFTTKAHNQAPNIFIPTYS
jgi:hypothetical protein